MAAGYADTPLIDKLGIRPGHRLTFINEPDQYMDLLGGLPEDVEIITEGGDLDFLHLFASNRNQLVEEFPAAKKKIKKDGMIWVSWPKLSSPLASDLRDSIVREVGLANGLVDVKVAAIDEDWSGIKFVYRSQDRD